MIIFGFVLLRCPLHNEKERPNFTNDLAPINQQEWNAFPQYVHISGGMFLKFDPIQKVFMWAWNHMLSQRYRTM